MSYQGRSELAIERASTGAGGTNGSSSTRKSCSLLLLHGQISNAEKPPIATLDKAEVQPLAVGGDRTVM